MKQLSRWVLLVVALGSIMLFSGCGASSDEASEPVTTPDAVVDEVVTPQPTESAEIATEPEEAPQVEEPTPAYSYVVYQPNDTVDGIVEVALTSEEEPTLEIISQGYFDQLAMDTYEAAILSFDEETHTLDMNEGFGTLMSYMGTSGELVILDSLVTTVCQWYGIDELTLTVEGQVLETGHSIYDFALAKTSN